MNVLVTVARTPFVPSAAGERGALLVARLAATAGIEAELMTLPTRAAGAADIAGMIDEAVLCGLLRTENSDRMIALNFPACMLHHPSAVLWIAGEEDLPFAAALAEAHRFAFARAAGLFCGSPALRGRIAGWGGGRAELLPVPGEGDEAGWAEAIARLLA